jgi:hypothetical protein
MRVPVIADPKQNPSKQEKRGQNGEGTGILYGRMEGHHGYSGEIGGKLLESVQDKFRVDFECRSRLGRSADPHRGIEALSGNDANPDYAGQQRKRRTLEDKGELIAGRRPLFGGPMPNKLCAEKEREGEYPVSNEHEQKGPLSSREAEILYPRVTADPRFTGRRRIAIECDRRCRSVDCP